MVSRARCTPVPANLYNLTPVLLLRAQGDPASALSASTSTLASQRPLRAVSPSSSTHNSSQALHAVTPAAQHTKTSTAVIRIHPHALTAAKQLAFTPTGSAKGRQLMSGSDDQKVWFASPARLLCLLLDMEVSDTEHEAVMKQLNRQMGRGADNKGQFRKAVEAQCFAQDKTDAQSPLYRIASKPRHYAMQVNMTLLQLQSQLQRDKVEAQKTARLLARALPKDAGIRRKNFALPSPSPVPYWPTPQQRVVQASATANQFNDSFAFDQDKHNVVPSTWGGVVEDAGTKPKRKPAKKRARDEQVQAASDDEQWDTVTRVLDFDSSDSCEGGGSMTECSADAGEAVGSTSSRGGRRQRRRLHDSETTTVAGAAMARAAVAITASSSHEHIQTLLDRERCLNELQTNETIVFALQQCVDQGEGQELAVQPAFLLGHLKNRNQLLRRLARASL